MRKNDAIMELVAGYNAYTGAEDLSVSAGSYAPATTASCITVSASLISITVTISFTVTRQPE
ncbi:LxmA leader domain family RiPP [Nonomuraea roseola]|uniref:LxmA leader domain family RiPP n=1 Tax=Nonomuraea roseola TaxID=46179 RepID=A0ABV5QDN2_9ACTN